MHPDQVIARFAARQHSIVTRQQLLHAGLSREQVDYRIQRCALDRVHRGVFRVGPIGAPLWREMAASLACGAPAVVSHLSAAFVWGLRERASNERVHVSTSNGTRPHAGIVLHRVHSLAAGECVRRLGIRVTSTARTLLDVAAIASVNETERILAEALSRGSVRERQLRALLEQHRGERGASVLAALLSGGPKHTRSEAEYRFRAFVQESRLPEPEVNVKLAGYEVDFFWREAALVVEVDGLRFHRTRAAFRKDRQRDADLLRIGVRVLRVTWEQLTGERLALAALLGQTLGAGQAPGTRARRIQSLE